MTQGILNWIPLLSSNLSKSIYFQSSSSNPTKLSSGTQEIVLMTGFNKQLKPCLRISLRSLSTFFNWKLLILSFEIDTFQALNLNDIPDSLQATQEIFFITNYSKGKYLWKWIAHFIFCLCKCYCFVVRRSRIDGKWDNVFIWWEKYLPSQPSIKIGLI